MRTGRGNTHAGRTCVWYKNTIENGNHALNTYTSQNEDNENMTHSSTDVQKTAKTTMDAKSNKRNKNATNVRRRNTDLIDLINN